MELQQALIDAGYDPREVDSIFGPRTQAAVEEFQGDHGLEVDGIADRRTLAALDKVAEASDVDEPGEGRRRERP